MFDSNTLYIIVDPSKAIAGANAAVKAIMSLDGASAKLSKTLTKTFEDSAKKADKTTAAVKALYTPLKAVVGILTSAVPIKLFSDLASEIVRVDRIYNGFLAMMNVTTNDMAKSVEEFDYLSGAANKYGVSIEALTKSYGKLAAST